ncbi:MAG: type IV pilus biogenesis protein PilP [Acidithiobacillus sp.]
MNIGRKRSLASLLLLTLSVASATSLGQETNEQTPEAASALSEIETINGQIIRLKALTAQAEERLKLLRAQNQIEQELRQGRQAAVSSEVTAQGPIEQAPQVALISGSGSSLRAVLRYANGSSDEAWVGKQLAGGYVVYSITSRQVRLKAPDGKIIVAGTASPTPEAGREPTARQPSSTQQAPFTTPGVFPRGAMEQSVPPSAPPVQPLTPANPA